MTMSTRIAVTDPVPVRELFEHCQRLLGASGAVTYDEPNARPNARLGNKPDQGFAAWLLVEYGADGPLVDEWPDEDPPRWPEPAAIQVTFDTGYGYQVNGAHCGDLHAWLIHEVGEWLDTRNARYHWQHEETGEWYLGRASLSERGNVSLGALTVAR